MLNEGHTSSPLSPVRKDVGLSVSMQKTLFLAESVMLRFRIGYLDWSTVQGNSREELNSPKECFNKVQFIKSHLTVHH